MNIDLQRKTFIVWLLLVFFTALAIYIIYEPLFCLIDSELYKALNDTNGHSLFIIYPWFRTSIIMSTFTCLWVYTFWFYHVKSGRLFDDDHAQNDYLDVIAGLFAILIVPVNFLICYPSDRELEIQGNLPLYLLISLCVIHGIGFLVLQRWVLKQWNKKKHEEEDEEE
jgi:hypothetical protein